MATPRRTNLQTKVLSARVHENIHKKCPPNLLLNLYNCELYLADVTEKGIASRDVHRKNVVLRRTDKSITKKMVLSEI